MKTFVGIDLGSTTTKAVLLDENRKVIGHGITNSRSNYATAARVASQEARVDGQFTLFRRALTAAHGLIDLDAFLGTLERAFRLEQFLEQLDDLEQTCIGQIQGERFAKVASGVKDSLGEVFKRLRAEAPELYAPGAKRKSDFFRDIAGSRYHTHAEEVARAANLPYDLLLNVYDKSIIEVENRPPAGELSDKFRRALGRVLENGRLGQIGGSRHPEDDRGRARGRLGGNLSGRHRLRPRDAAVLQGAYPLGNPLPRPRRPHDVSADAHGARHRRPGHQGHPDRRARYRRQLPDERPLRGGLRPLSRLYRRRDEHGPARIRAPWR